MTTSELCRDIATEAARRSPNVHRDELWAVLRVLDARQPRLIVDLCPEPAVWWAWWSIGALVIGVAPGPVRPGRAVPGRQSLPSGIEVVVGDPRLLSTRARVSDLAGDDPIDAMVLGSPDSEDGARANFADYAPMVRPGGLVLVHGIASEQYPGIGRFWSGIDGPGRHTLVGSGHPDGYGIVEIHGKELSSNG